MLRSLVFSYEDQSILINGHHTRDNHALAYHLISALLEHVERLPPNLGPSILLGSELLYFLCCSEGKCGGAVVVVAITVSPATLAFTAAKLSCLLLDTSHLAEYKVWTIGVCCALFSLSLHGPCPGILSAKCLPVCGGLS